jgi:hypothetical protein
LASLNWVLNNYAIATRTWILSLKSRTIDRVYLMLCMAK